MRLNLLEITWEYIYFQGIKYLQEETKSDAAIEANLEDGDEEESRQQWSNPIEFLLSCVAMSVGLGKDLFRNVENTQITLSLLASAWTTALDSSVQVKLWKSSKLNFFENSFNKDKSVGL